jgi:hypothetical protein
LRMDMFWKQSSRDRVTEGLAGRRRGWTLVGDIFEGDAPCLSD